MHFAWPWLLLVLPLPWLLRILSPPAESAGGAALRVPFLQELAAERDGPQRGRSLSWPLWVAALGWLALVAAGARPQWLGEPLALPVTGRDLLLAVDLSGSMQERDFEIGGQRVNRLTATKWVAGEFIRRREGDRRRRGGGLSAARQGSGTRRGT